MSQTQILTRDAFGVTYANPTDPDFRVRFKTTSSQKSLNGVSVMNFVTEIIVNDNVPVTLGNTSANDPVAVRIRVSGSLASAARRDAILKSIAAQLGTWTNENVFAGFEPATAPNVVA